ncbi:hypothetical protein FQ320_15560 [Oceaniovalibus sp. ACAM 378]|nr:type II toxin-antitoxin system CcdA family antitoxin [Oceaniovalibus sp. ACAM 378]TYB86794.1 hypothetical protein FQ320_15560 [Oceaniovalibus sp. ACAM 378]
MTVQPRKPTNLSLDADFLAQGRGFKINLSRAVQNGLRAAVAHLRRPPRPLFTAA